MRSGLNVPALNSYWTSVLESERSYVLATRLVFQRSEKNWPTPSVTGNSTVCSGCPGAIHKTFGLFICESKKVVFVSLKNNWTAEKRVGSRYIDPWHSRPAVEFQPHTSDGKFNKKIIIFRQPCSSCFSDTFLNIFVAL